MYRTPSLTQTSVSSSTTLVAHWTGKRHTPAPKRRVSVTPHCLFSPIHYEPGYAYPLIVWLHGRESSELELQQVMPLISVRNYVGVSPRGTYRTNKTERLYSWRQTAGEVADACQRVVDCIEIASDQFNLHPERIFIAGYGEGGTMALRVGMEHPELFAGAISLAGRVPRGNNAFLRINAARRLPLLLSAAPTEDQYSNQQIKEDLRLLHSGGFPLSLLLYPGDNEPLVEDMFWDLDSWIMEQFCPTAVTAG